MDKVLDYEGFLEEFKRRLERALGVELERRTIVRNTYKSEYLVNKDSHGAFSQDATVHLSAQYFFSVYERGMREHEQKGDDLGTASEQIFSDIVLAGRLSKVEKLPVFDRAYLFDHVFYGLIGQKENREYMCLAPHKRFLDMLVVYYVDCGEQGIVELDYGMLGAAGVSAQEIWEAAVVNTPKLFPRTYREKAVSPEELECSFMVVVDGERGNASAGMLDYEVLDEYEKRLSKGENLYVYPLGIHRFVICGAKERAEERLSEMLKNGVCRQVRQRDDQLTVTLYRYTKLDGLWMVRYVAGPQLVIG
jgi:hypothetical protein